MTETSETLRVGVVGFGYWGPNHVRNFAALRSKEVTVVAIADRDPNRRLHAREMFPDVPVVVEADDLVNDVGIDALIIATPAHTHFAIARLALLAGKHILVEKPVTTNLTEAHELVELAADRNLTLMVGHTFEYAPAVNYIHELIESGAIGETLHIRSQRVNLGQYQTHINVLWDLAPHDISILSYLLGKTPTHVSAIGRSHVNPRIEDIVSLTLEYEDNLMANVILSWLDPRKSREMTIIGSKKMLVYDDTATTDKIRIFDKGAYGPDEYRSFGEFQVSYRYGDMISPHLDNYEPLREQSDHFVDCIRYEKTPRSDGESGARVVRVLSAAQLSLDEDGQRIAVSDQRVEHVQGSVAAEGFKAP